MYLKKGGAMDGKRTHKNGNNADLQTNIDRRIEFNKLKKTKDFLEWKTKQMKLQIGRCAWCERRLDKYWKGVHIDHVMPLYHGGKNNYDNLVLTHRKCNLSKWVKPESVPVWIQNRKNQYDKIMRLQSYRKKQKEIIEDLYQDVDLENQHNELRELMWRIGEI